ncbi:hypothetical protein Nepgr_022845 [Nepenthes gracilis]|uniref:Uncharacterized protein n=1 Tax=Nepenthes gracilis TaxID=150966 RepID=A0AAD3SZT1_NEPGR|nr:hypothetical protein Nepgr_022845 [Nepenthes gracilis]
MLSVCINSIEINLIELEPVRITRPQRLQRPSRNSPGEHLEQLIQKSNANHQSTVQGFGSHQQQKKKSNSTVMASSAEKPRMTSCPSLSKYSEKPAEAAHRQGDFKPTKPQSSPFTIPRPHSRPTHSQSTRTRPIERQQSIPETQTEPRHQKLVESSPTTS